jgi:hypothetical protein
VPIWEPDERPGRLAKGDNDIRDQDEMSPMTEEVAEVLTGPLLGATAVAALLLVVLADEAVGALITLVHEAGHMAIAAVTGSRINHFQVFRPQEGVTVSAKRGWGPSRIVGSAAGYTAPPLVGLGGAALLATGRAGPLLWTAVVLLVLTLIKAEPEWTTALVLISATFIGYIAIYGSALLQAAVAAGVVWLLLFGGIRHAAESGTGDTSDAAHLARDTLIPRKAWKAAFVVVGVVCLWNAALLLAP